MARRIANPLLGWLGCVIAFMALAVVALKSGAGEHADATLLSKAVLDHGTVAHGVATGFAHLGDPAPMLLMVIGLVALGLHWGRGRETLAGLAVIAGANLSTQFLKATIAHDRFHTFLGEGQPYANAFPSGHTTAAASIGVALVLIAPPRLRGLAIAIAAGLTAAVGISVVALEWHYPSDVLGGLLIVGGWGFAAVAALRLLAGREEPARHRLSPVA